MITTLAYIVTITLLAVWLAAGLLLGRFAYRRIEQKLLATQTALASVGGSLRDLGKSDKKRTAQLQQLVCDLQTFESERNRDHDAMLDVLTSQRQELTQLTSAIHRVDSDHDHAVSRLREDLARLQGRLDERESLAGLQFRWPGRN